MPEVAWILAFRYKLARSTSGLMDRRNKKQKSYDSSVISPSNSGLQQSSKIWLGRRVIVYAQNLNRPRHALGSPNAQITAWTRVDTSQPWITTHRRRFNSVSAGRHPSCSTVSRWWGHPPWLTWSSSSISGRPAAELLIHAGHHSHLKMVRPRRH